MSEKRICRECGAEYDLHPKKPGKIYHCPDCSVEVVKPLFAKVAYPSKNSCFVEIEITDDARAAHLFNSAQTRRGGSGVTGSLIEGKS